MDMMNSIAGPTKVSSKDITIEVPGKDSACTPMRSDVTDIMFTWDYIVSLQFTIVGLVQLD